MVDEVASISEETAAAAENAAAAAQEQTASVSEVTTSVESLSAQSDDLQTLLAEFDVGDAAVQADTTGNSSQPVAQPQD
jgi:methyl-accepting chemotaxis protein